MEGLQQEAESVFDRKFTSCPAKRPYEAVTISRSVSGIRFIDHSIPSGKLVDFIESSHETCGAGPWLRLIRVDVDRRNDPQKMYIPKPVWRQLWTAFSIDPYFLSLVAKSNTGFHFRRPRAKDGAEGHLSNFYFGHTQSKIIGSYDHQTFRTSAIALTRTTKDSMDAWANFYSGLRQHRSLVAHLNFLPLAFVSAHLSWANDFLRQQQLGIEQVEAETGFSPWVIASGGRGTGLPRQGAESSRVLSLTDLSRKTSSHSVAVQDLIYVFKSLEQLIEHMRQSQPRDSNEQKGEDEGIAAALEMLAQVIQPNLLFLDCLSARANNQLNVIFNLITRDDTLASIELAKASIEVTNAAKEDSSSMKIIAAMTMVFLPGTFFAALFAIPSLKWDQLPVIQGNFWVYWAFTLPSTATIFALWAILTGRLQSRLRASVNPRVADRVEPPRREGE